MWIEDKWMTSVLESVLPCNQSSSARIWNKLTRHKKYSRRSFSNNAWLNHFRVTSVTRIMLATLHDTFTNAFSNTSTKPLANNLWRPTGAYVIWMKINFGSFANAVQNALCARCCLPRRVIQSSTPCQWPILSVWDSLFMVAEMCQYSTSLICVS